MLWGKPANKAQRCHACCILRKSLLNRATTLDKKNKTNKLKQQAVKRECFYLRKTREQQRKHICLLQKRMASMS
jgi:hypothetical protein